MADIATIIQEAMLVLTAAEKIVQIGGDVAPRIEDAIAILSGQKTLSADERAALIAEQQGYESRIDAAVAADAAAAEGTGT